MRDIEIEEAISRMEEAFVNGEVSDPEIYVESVTVDCKKKELIINGEKITKPVVVELLNGDALLERILLNSEKCTPFSPKAPLVKVDVTAIMQTS